MRGDEWAPTAGGTAHGFEFETTDAALASFRERLPELARLPDQWIHRPWETPAAVLAEAGVEPGRTYPRPVVDFRESREAALAAYHSIRRPA